MGLEVRELRVFPYVKNGINDTLTAANGLTALKSGVMNVGAFRMDLDISLDVKYPENFAHRRIRLTPLSWRIDFATALTTLTDIVGVGDPISIQSKGGYWGVSGTVLFVDNNTLEILTVTEAGVGIDDEGVGSTELLIRNFKHIESIDIKYNLSPRTKVFMISKFLVKK